MKANEEVEKLIQRVNGGDFNKYIADLDGTDFGLYLPAFAEGDNVKLMLQGYSQLERNLAISVSEGENDILGSKVVGWIGDQDAKDSKCTHGSTAKCTHCTTHPSNCRHCTHNRGKNQDDFRAPELDYDSSIRDLDNKRHLLDPLAKDQLGLTLLHGHNDKFMFTKLPEGHVAVISDGITSFRREEDVLSDETFVPNIWRASEGQFRIAGGYSSKIADK